jgi:hypothetical protein
VTLKKDAVDAIVAGQIAWHTTVAIAPQRVRHEQVHGGESAQTNSIPHDFDVSKGTTGTCEYRIVRDWEWP